MVRRTAQNKVCDSAELGVVRLWWYAQVRFSGYARDTTQLVEGIRSVSSAHSSVAIGYNC
ncbi:MAG: hypothetical protein LBF72_01205 [Holosporales bacterium]|nr:hypothetical protein [Holosporales bacterium]